MNPAFTLPGSSGTFHPWALLFAQNAEKDLDFDDGLDDMDDLDPKPPSRRPLVLILLLLIIAGVGYFLMDPGALSSLTSMITAPASKTQDQAVDSNTPTRSEGKAASTSHPPTPSYREGQLVAVVTPHDGPSTIKLSGDAEGKQPGPLVKTGELLTILDGAIVENTWIYLVHTKSGASGWVSEHQLKAQS
ncbi:hypothetical protein [Candidatus Nitronereus thalassa]|uniref:SH3b domain-containing protein n=1 Tax=Candidatus Nitronereus thalassa TaxID=3020898 RepID=A0ABU3K693_9BACT|nr:hypothetical protein [Candidatus Nitronereus thalassa]MDT7041939.1 hypothetical protein [Candidatus Nitronereus thalassa]